jgi:hypothetical protein
MYINHDKCCENISKLHDRVILIDDIISKISNVPELYKMSTIELRMYEFINRQWNQRSIQASLAVKNKSKKQAIEIVENIMEKWYEDVIEKYNIDVIGIYKLARKAGLKKAKGQIKESLAFNSPIKKAESFFDKKDKSTIASMVRNNIFHIKKHYKDNVSRAVSSAVNSAQSIRRLPSIVREALGRVVSKGGLYTTSLQYFESLVANSTTIARAFGQVKSFDDLKVTRYQISNPLDHRTCKFCSHIAGKIFTVRQANTQIERELSSTPEEISTIHPWLSLRELLKISPNPGRQNTSDSVSLANAGLSLPPYHFRCRCTVDVL